MNGDWLTWLGIKIPDLVAGMFGGIVKALVFQREGPVKTVVSAVVGAITANYLGTLIAEQLGWEKAIGAVCFAVGITSMVVCQFIIDKANRFAAKGKSDD